MSKYTSVAAYCVKDRSTGNYVTAPSGWCRDCKTGELKRDGTNPNKSGPEMGKDRYWFTSKKYAEQQAAKLADAVIYERAL